MEIGRKMAEEKSYFLPARLRAMSFSPKRQCLKLEFFSGPKLIGSVSLAWTVILLLYLFRVSLVGFLLSLTIMSGNRVNV